VATERIKLQREVRRTGFRKFVSSIVLEYDPLPNKRKEMYLIIFIFLLISEREILYLKEA
jgi:hypothetical protein